MYAVWCGLMRIGSPHAGRAILHVPAMVHRYMQCIDIFTLDDRYTGRGPEIHQIHCVSALLPDTGFMI